MRLLYSSLDTSLVHQAGPESGQRHLLAKLVALYFENFHYPEVWPEICGLLW